VHLTVAEVRRAKELGLWLVQNPRSNEGNKVGYPRALVASADVALGTDGWPADLRVERGALLRLGRANGDAEATLEARVHAGRRLMSALTGARIVAIEDGASADVVVGVPNAPPKHVLVAGRVVVEDGVLVTADFDRIRAEAREEAPRLWSRMSALPEPA
jgi:cytosine/adenosine deaminase-related metal-dependent hydrolase